LAAPGHGSPNNLLRCVRYVGGRIHKCRILPSQLKQDRSEILSGGTSDDFADLHASGEEDEVKRKLQEFGYFVLGAPYCCHAFGLEVLRDQLYEEIRGRGNLFRYFQHARIARGQDPDRRMEAEREGAVEGPNYESWAVRLSDNFGRMSRSSKEFGNGGAHRLHPLP